MMASKNSSNCPLLSSSRWIRIGDIEIHCNYDDSRYERALQKYLHRYLISEQDYLSSPNNGKITFVHRSLEDSPALDVSNIEEPVTFVYENGAKLTLDPSKSIIYMQSDKIDNLTFRDILQDRFLFPLSGCLKLQDSHLMHAALLSFNSVGVLLLGASNCGKSSISYSCLKEGFSFYSDEHPILLNRQDKIIGRSFYSHIRFDRKSVELLEVPTQDCKWDAVAERFIVDLEKWREQTPVDDCTIQHVLHLRPRENDKFRIEKLEENEAFLRLRQDDYLYRDFQNKKATEMTMSLINFYKALSKHTETSLMTYTFEDIPKTIPDYLKSLCRI